MSLRSIRISAGLLVALVLASEADAAAITFVASEVDLRVDAEVFCNPNPFDPHPCVGGMTVTDSDDTQRVDVSSVDESIDAQASIPSPLVGASALADLQASVTDTTLAASSRAFGRLFEPGPTFGGSASASVFYQVTFSVASLTSYDLHIELLAYTMFGEAYSRVALQDALGGSIFDVEWDPFMGEVLVVFDEMGTLTPGVYSLIAESRASTLDGDAGSNFAITGSFVPEPGTGALLALGLTGIARKRARPRRGA